MENKQRKYYNRSSLQSRSKEVIKGEHKVLKLKFLGVDRETKAPKFLWYTMFLTQENNERNQDTLKTLGCTAIPPMVTYDTVDELPGVGNNVIDLVSETNEAGYENMKYINEPKFDLKCFENDGKKSF